MNRDAIEREIAGLLREHILLGSDREVDFDATLGPEVGLDSLGLMEFLGILEEKFSVEFPDTLWSDRRQFTLGSLVDYLDTTRPDTSVGRIPNVDTQFREPTNSKRSDFADERADELA
jgi:acyl carrier protein